MALNQAIILKQISQLTVNCETPNPLQYAPKQLTKSELESQSSAEIWIQAAFFPTIQFHAAQLEITNSKHGPPRSVPESTSL